METIITQPRDHESVNGVSHQYTLCLTCTFHACLRQPVQRLRASISSDLPSRTHRSTVVRVHEFYRAVASHEAAFCLY
ncbi:hypothetical protein C8Q73DRAFT_717845 [Cubamyces lactineus]|nr:hypothetical protein C8Q73DRAFT_717845 [Cubamyces lactineus]